MPATWRKNREQRGRSGVWPRLLNALLAIPVMASVFSGDLVEPPIARATSLEYEVKAAFLLNFTKFVQWPAEAAGNADSPFTVCVIGNDPFGRTLDDIVKDEAVGGHKIVVQRPQAEQKTCQLEYFAEDSSAPVATPRSGALTVGEGEKFLRQGGIIAFVLDEGRVRFDINLKAANNAGLKLSSKLLAVARSVER